MVTKKEKQYLIFYLDDNKTVQYNLSTGEVIGKKGVVVKDLCTQLRGYTIQDVIDSVEDTVCRELLAMVYSQYKHICNVGTLLNKVRTYKNYEQILSAGVQINKLDLDYFCNKDIPRGLIKICREYHIVLKKFLYLLYIHDPNLVRYAFSIDCPHLAKEDILNILICNFGGWNYPYGCFYKLVDEYRYNVKSLLLYLDYLYTYEGLRLDKYVGVLTEIQDYAKMSKGISNKYEKYPKNFLTVHQITSRNYNRLKEEFEEAAFKRRIDETLEKRVDGYKFIYPKSTQDIKDEAVQQGNCVASYIQEVIDGVCHILFLRQCDSLNKSCVTVEVRDDRVVQAKGKYNRDITHEEAGIIQKYQKYLDKREKGVA